MDEHIEEGKVKGYYETVFAELVDEEHLSLHAVSFNREAWYEIDTISDLAEAEKLFPKELSETLIEKPLAYGVA